MKKRAIETVPLVTNEQPPKLIHLNLILYTESVATCMAAKLVFFRWAVAIFKFWALVRSDELLHTTFEFNCPTKWVLKKMKILCIVAVKDHEWNEN